jgi:hypothetical protein
MLSMDDVRARMKASGIQIAENRLEMVRVLLSNALTPVQAMDTRALATTEPAVTFDARVKS